jgi:hypothetical protein
MSAARPPPPAVPSTLPSFLLGSGLASPRSSRDGFLHLRTEEPVLVSARLRSLPTLSSLPYLSFSGLPLATASFVVARETILCPHLVREKSVDGPDSPLAAFSSSQLSGEGVSVGGERPGSSPGRIFAFYFWQGIPEQVGYIRGRGMLDESGWHDAAASSTLTHFWTHTFFSIFADGKLGSASPLQGRGYREG